MSETTTVLLATSAMGRSKTETMDLDAIHEKYGIEPRQLIEVKSLMGDTSDNIPGVKGIGEKTAMTLVKNFGTLDSVYDHLDSPIIKTPAAGKSAGLPGRCLPQPHAGHHPHRCSHRHSGRGPTR